MRPLLLHPPHICLLFQSTHPVGRATRSEASISTADGFFNPRPPWGERQIRHYSRGAKIIFSIHALREESDKKHEIIYLKIWKDFQSTLSVGRATKAAKAYLQEILIFNPRSPWGERPGSHHQFKHPNNFQSTLSVGRATANRDQRYQHSLAFSIHASRGGCDQPKQKHTLEHQLFQSTHPVGDATSRWPVH